MAVKFFLVLGFLPQVFTVAGFEALNPGVTCPTLVAGRNYCVFGSVSSGPTTNYTTTGTTFTTSTLPPILSTTTTTTTSSSPHQPTQPGLVANCNNFYLVSSSSDTCVGIETKFGISAAQFSSWNPFIHPQCDNLWLGYYVCVGVPGATTVAPPATTTTPSGPQPQMPNIVSNCKSFRLVQSGDSCYTIEQATGITLSQFRSWNPTVDASCDNLWLG
ncbi:hypothetical protein VTK56DRAFT_3087 [Thermocarpiscus australiensis]